jgi:nicotinamide riboside transporter PnuC
VQILAWVTTILCLAGAVLNVKKNRTCFVVWFVGNVLWLIWDIANGFASRVVLDVVQGGMALWGIYEWKKGEK